MNCKEIKHHNRYEVQEDGAVFSTKHNSRRELKQAEHRGYRRVALSKNNLRRYFPVHRLVAEAFVENPQAKPFVNHKDGNRRNNHYTNLEWCTAQENQAHSRDVLGNTHRGERNPNWGNRMSRFYPSPEIRNRLIELGVPRHKHDIVSLGEMLPKSINWGQGFKDFEQIYHEERKLWIVRYYTAGSGIAPRMEEANTEADARAKMLIYLLENHLGKA